MSQPWIKVWSEKILSSVNLQECNFTEHSLFMQYLLRIRPDGEFIGKMVYPVTGEPIPDKVLWKQMKLRPSLYRKAKAALLKRGIIKIDPNSAIVLRKFNELHAQLQHNSSTTPAQSKAGLTLQNRTEEKRTEQKIFLAKKPFVTPAEYMVQCSNCSGNGFIMVRGSKEKCELCNGKGSKIDAKKLPKET